MSRDHLKTFHHYFLPKQKITHLAGLFANIETPALKNRFIHYFIKKYGVDMSEAQEENPENYACFNDFFIRHLKPEVRPLASAEIVSPVDGVISELGAIQQGQIIQAKSRFYSVQQLLACDEKRSKQFEHGCFATFYLSPKDYHRIHMPIEGTLKEIVYIPGKLFSVQPTTSRVIPYLFARNERVVAFFDTPLGLMAMVLVGATIVGAIHVRWEGVMKRSSQIKHFTYREPRDELFVKQGEEIGYFKLGSTVIMLFAEGEKVQWLNHWQSLTSVRYGEAFGCLRN